MDAGTPAPGGSIASSLPFFAFARDRGWIYTVVMMATLGLYAFWLMSLLQAAPAPPTTATAVAPTRFVGEWVGTQRWVIENPPPNARPDQPVTLTIQEMGGKLVGTMKPFLGGEDGANFTESTIVGQELHATATVGRPREGRGRQAQPPGTPSSGDPEARVPSSGDPETRAPAERPGGGRGVFPSEPWKRPLKVVFVLKNNGVNMTGTADVMMGDAKWLKFEYDLSKKRSRY